MIRALVLLALLWVAWPASAASVSLGNIAINYDEKRWEVVARPGNPYLAADAAMSLALACIAEPCRKRPVVWASAKPLTSGGMCAPRYLPEVGQLMSRDEPAIAAGPLKLMLLTTHSGCRARTPLHRRACGADMEFIYQFGTGAHFGCGGIEGVPEPMFRELLGGISLR